MENKFLRDFLARQAKDAIIESTVVEPVAKGKAKKTKSKSKHGTASGKAPFGDESLEARMASLISEQPSKKEVLAYFKDRISELVAQDEW
tara:strand:- start:537 stop:806 length:270 start_codon:yes stop_codon:yes gene_type:complete